MPRLRSKRRVAGLKESDYDHEIFLVDHDGSSEPPAPSATTNDDDTPVIAHSDTLTALLDPSRSKDTGGGSSTAEAEEVGSSSVRATDAQTESHGTQGQAGPSIEIQGPTPIIEDDDEPRQDTTTVRPRRSSLAPPKAEIDVLYENERGGFMCGIALFSSKALGGLDPPAWTNVYHKASPTSIKTAQLPDPSWEWAWPEWRIDQRAGCDAGGWVYAFAFHKKLSWHGPKWWSSFVRRRAWTRKRVKLRPEDAPTDPHMMRTDYFTVRPASERTRRSSVGGGGSSSSVRGSGDSVASGVSGGRRSSWREEEEEQEKPEDICDPDALMHALRMSRIDREKIEAVENYLTHAPDLSPLLHGMIHDVMGQFIFQASRRLLLTRLMQMYDDVSTRAEAGAEAGGEAGETLGYDLSKRSRDLKAVAEHADEEVRRLAYWSDVKRMAEGGHTEGAVEGKDDEGEEGEWTEERWQGVDQSGAAVPGGGELPK